MVLENIGFLLGNFLRNSQFQYVFFSWVIHLEEIYTAVLSRLGEEDFDLVKITLLCNEQELRRRVQKDVLNGKRDSHSVEEGIRRQSLYQSLDSIKVDVSGMSLQKVVRTAKAIVLAGGRGF